MPAEIKRITEDMLADVAALECECFSEPWSEQSLRLLVGERAVGFAAFVDGRLAAYAGMLCVLDEGQITNIATYPEFRRQGLARMLLDAIDSYSRDNGIAFLSLEVRESNTAARTLYESCDWTSAGARKNFYKQPIEDAVIMTKTLIEVL